MSLKTLFPFIQPLNNDGCIVPGGKLTFYAAGGVVKKNTWADAQGVTLNSNPVILNTDTGRAFIFMANDGAYDVLFTDEHDVLIWTLPSFIPYAPVV